MAAPESSEAARQGEREGDGGDSGSGDGFAASDYTAHKLIRLLCALGARCEQAQADSCPGGSSTSERPGADWVTLARSRFLLVVVTR